MKFKLEIELGNDEMKTPAHIRAALANVVNRIDPFNGRCVGLEGRIVDVNGNTVGKYEVVADSK